MISIMILGLMIVVLLVITLVEFKIKQVILRISLILLVLCLFAFGVGRLSADICFRSLAAGHSLKINTSAISRDFAEIMGDLYKLSEDQKYSILHARLELLANKLPIPLNSYELVNLMNYMSYKYPMVPLDSQGYPIKDPVKRKSE